MLSEQGWSEFNGIPGIHAVRWKHKKLSAPWSIYTSNFTITFIEELPFYSNFMAELWRERPKIWEGMLLKQPYKYSFLEN